MIREPFIGELPLANHIRERNEAIALAERVNRSVAKASEAHLPADERRQIIDLSELRAVAVECAYVFPFAALATVGWFAANIP